MDRELTLKEHKNLGLYLERAENALSKSINKIASKLNKEERKRFDTIRRNIGFVRNVLDDNFCAQHSSLETPYFGRNLK